MRILSKIFTHNRCSALKEHFSHKKFLVKNTEEYRTPFQNIQIRFNKNENMKSVSMLEKDVLILATPEGILLKKNTLYLSLSTIIFDKIIGGTLANNSFLVQGDHFTISSYQPVPYTVFSSIQSNRDPKIFNSL